MEIFMMLINGNNASVFPQALSLDNVQSPVLSQAFYSSLLSNAALAGPQSFQAPQPQFIQGNLFFNGRLQPVIFVMIGNSAPLYTAQSQTTDAVLQSAPQTQDQGNTSQPAQTDASQSSEPSQSDADQTAQTDPNAQAQTQPPVQDQSTGRHRRGQFRNWDARQTVSPPQTDTRQTQVPVQDQFRMQQDRQVRERHGPERFRNWNANYGQGRQAWIQRFGGFHHGRHHGCGMQLQTSGPDIGYS
jgi:hypothetical protein